ncbi:MAG: SRPBCC domain-containing protein [Pseudomonadota bacterium]
MDDMDAIFKALADPSRRAVLDALREKDGQSLSELEGHLVTGGAKMSRFGVMKHLGVLEAATLITTQRRGRFKFHYLNAVVLQEVIDRWIDPYRVKPAARAFLNLKHALETPMLDQESKPDFVMQTYIRCGHDALWEALTNAEAMSAYHFLSPQVTREGETYTYQHGDGSVMLVCRTLHTEPKSLIAATFEPHWGVSDPVPASRTIYRLTPEAAHMKLVVEHYDLNFPVVPGEGVADGWERWASGLKTYLETGEATRFNARGVL